MRKGLVGVRGQGCCCYDAMATAPWEASLELNEFPPQLEWSGRRQSAQDSERAAQGLSASTATKTGPGPSTLPGNTRPGVSASPAASLVMTPGKISHTSVRRCSKTGETATPCSPSLAKINWGGIVFNPILTCLLVSSSSPATRRSFPWIFLDHHGWKNLHRSANDDVGFHAGCRYEPAGGGTGKAGGAGAGALWR